MTYTPVENPIGGRTPKPIPEQLLRLLRHSASTGARVRIALTPDDDPEPVAELRRALVRAGYREFPDKTIHKRITGTEFVFWVTAKRQAAKKRKKR